MSSWIKFFSNIVQPYSQAVAKLLPLLIITKTYLIVNIYLYIIFIYLIKDVVV